MRKVLAFLFALIFIPCISVAKSGAEHVADMLTLVFENSSARSQEVRSCLYEFTKTIDNFKVVKSLPLGPDGHRLYGHWGYSDAIPFNREPLKGMLERIASTSGRQAADAARQRMIQAWRQDVAKMEDISARMLGVRGRTAKGFAGILYDVHLMGDYSGEKLGALQDIEALKNDLIKNVNRVFGNHSAQSGDIIRGLDAAFKSGATATGKSERMIAFLSESDEFRVEFQKLLKRERFLASILKVPEITELKGGKTAKDIERLARTRTGSDVRVVPALVRDGRLLVSLESGAGAGFLVFAVDAAAPSWQYAHGEILKPEYRERIVQAAINGAGVGGATAVMVILGANPAGLAVIGVATGAYIAIDKLQQVYRENRNAVYLTKADLLAFGIPFDSVLDVAIDKGIPLNLDNWH